jgi:hypothetical protein
MARILLTVGLLASWLLIAVLVWQRGEAATFWTATQFWSNLPAWVQAIGSVAAIVAAVWIPQRQRSAEREETRVGHLEAIAVDIETARRMAQTYVRSEYKAPAYRLELVGRSTSLPALLTSGALNAGEATHLVQFYIDAVSFNHCLDRVAASLADESGLPIEQEISRATVKANHLIPGTERTRYTPAMAVVRANLPPEAIQRLKIAQGEISLDDE